MNKKRNTGIILCLAILLVNIIAMTLWVVLSHRKADEPAPAVTTEAVDGGASRTEKDEEALQEISGEEPGDLQADTDETKEASAISEETESSGTSDTELPEGTEAEDEEYNTLETEPKLLAFKKYVATPTEYISLRKQPGYSSETIAHITPGTVLDYLGEAKKMGTLFYKVRDHKSGRTGYVVSNYATPLGDVKYLKPKFSIVNTKDSAYTYDDLKKDIKQLCKKYPEYLTCRILGKSLDNRDIYQLTLGNPDATHRVFIEAGIHGREAMSSALVMGMMEYYCAYAKKASFKGLSYKKFLSEYAFDIVPMVNPDGINIAFLGEKGIQSSQYRKLLRECYNRDKKDLRYNSSSKRWYDITTTKGVNVKKERKKKYRQITYKEYLKIWKANAAGVDLNRNFDAEWEELDLRKQPSFEKYKGTAPESEPETGLIAEQIRNNDYEFYISYHTSGQVIYYDVPGNTRLTRSQSINRATWFRQMTGYTPVSEVSAVSADNLDLGGATDWAMSKMKIPGVCLEIGLGSSPVKASEFSTIFMQNRETWAAYCYYMKKCS